MNRLRFGVAVASAALAIAIALSPGSGATESALGPDASASLTLDGVPLTISGAALPPGASFDVSPPGSAEPSASATTETPYRELTVEDVPFGSRAEEDPVLGLAGPGQAAPAANALRSFRGSEGATSLGTYSASLFGSEVEGSASLVDLQVNSATASPVAIVEWVTEAGPRLWLVRSAEEVTGSRGSDVGAATALMGRLSDVTITGKTSAPSSWVNGAGIGAQAGQESSPSALNGSAVGAVGVPTPSWWNGNCNTSNYQAAAGEPAYPLGADWDGLEACGPRPYYGEGPDVGVRFPGASWGVLEWECVELSMRWMYQAWGVEPYPANGSGVVWNYSTFEASYNPGGPPLEAVSNNGGGPMPQPGDVLSYGATSSAGHTSVVAGTNINASGSGTVTVEEENASADGWDTVPVTDWILGGFDGGVSGWLHNPDFTLLPTDAVTAVRASAGNAWSLGGDDGAVPVFGGPWAGEGGGVLELPAVVAVPTSSGAGQPLYLVTGVDHDVWVSLGGGVWGRLSALPADCTDAPGATVLAATPGSTSAYTLVVACRGASGALSWVSGSVTAGTLPSGFTGWASLGGLIEPGISGAPAVTAVEPSSGTLSFANELTFFANGMDGRVWQTTDASGSAGWVTDGWVCSGHLAAAAFTASGTLTSAFACQGGDHAVWAATTSGSGWDLRRVGGAVIDGPGIALSPVSWTIVAEGGDHALWQDTSTTTTGTFSFAGWTSAGGVMTNGATAAALLTAATNS